MIEVKCTCCDCDKEFDEFEVIIRCYDCDESSSLESIKDVIKNTSEETHFWQDKELYCQYEGLEDFMRGVRRGYIDALLCICEHINEVDFFESLKFPLAEWDKKEKQE